MYSVQFIFFRFRQPKNSICVVLRWGQWQSISSLSYFVKSYLPQFSLKLIRWNFYASVYSICRMYGNTGEQGDGIVRWLDGISLARLCSPLNQWITKSSLIILSTHVYITKHLWLCGVDAVVNIRFHFVFVLFYFFFILHL